MVKLKLGISSLGYLVNLGIKAKFKDLTELLMQATESSLKYSEKQGFKVCEIILEPPVLMKKEDRKNFIDLCNSFSIEKQLHGNFIDVSLCSFNPWLSKATIEAYVDNAKICEEIGAKIMTIHPGVANLPVPAIKMHNKIQLAKSVNELLDATADLDVTICIENMPKDAGMLLTLPEIEELFSKVNRDDLFLTYDTSHFWTNDGDVQVLWNKYHDVIKNVHIVDNFDKETDTHPQIGMGKVNFLEIMNIIKKYDYKGALIIEVFSSTTLRNSVNHIKNFL